MHTVYGDPVERIDFDSIYDAKEFVDRYEGVEGFKIHGLSNWPMLYIHDNYPDNDFVPELIRVCPIDIEVDISEKFPDIERGDCPVTAITISRIVDGVEHFDTFGVKEFDSINIPDAQLSPESTVVYHQCRNEKDLLRRFLVVLNSEKYRPDVITGWNVNQFDVPYLVARITYLLGKDEANKLSPWRILNSRRVEIQGRDVITYSPVGVAILDYMDLYKKFTIPRDGQKESYSLNFICQVELGERKLDYSEYGNLTELYEKNPQKYYEYNIRDVGLVTKLDLKMKLMDLALVMAYDAGVNYQSIYGTIQQWDATIHKYLRERGFVVPFIRGGNEGGRIEGAFVKDPVPGLYRWPVSFDFASLYPKTIQQYNISPERFYDMLPGCSPLQFRDRKIDTDDLCGDQFTITANGCLFYRKEQGFLAALMESTFDKRVVYKSKMLAAEKEVQKCKDPVEKKKLENEVAKWSNFQHATKIKLNGLYGSLANRFNRWNDPRFAEAITKCGQLAFYTAEKAVNDYLNKVLKTTEYKDFVIAGDTDSLYVELGDLIDLVFKDQSDVQKVVDFIDKIAKEKIQAVINKACADLAEYMHCRENCMDMKREIIGNKAIWTGKKHYIVNVFDDEGVRLAKPKKKIKGLEAVKSSTPSAAREAIKEAIDYILNKDESDLHIYVSDLREKYKTMPLDEIAFNRGVSDIDKWDCKSGFKPSTPIHVKAAMNHNRIIIDKQIKKYALIRSGDKIKFVHLNPQNQYFAEVIGFIGILPPEFNLHQYVDRMKLFDKGFLNPLKGITDAIGWTTEFVPTLDDWITYE
jgi:DNA polymerase elongation subunit (family B)